MLQSTTAQLQLLRCLVLRQPNNSYPLVVCNHCPKVDMQVVSLHSAPMQSLRCPQCHKSRNPSALWGQPVKQRLTGELYSWSCHALKLLLWFGWDTKCQLVTVLVRSAGCVTKQLFGRHHQQTRLRQGLVSTIGYRSCHGVYTCSLQSVAP